MLAVGGFVILLAILIIGVVIAVYVMQALLLNKLHKLVYGKKTILGWIPFCNIYLLGKDTFNKAVGWILVGFMLLQSTFTFTYNGVETSYTLFPSLQPILSSVYSIAVIGLYIYAIVKYFQLKDGASGIE